MSIRVNPRALLVAVKAAYEGVSFRGAGTWDQAGPESQKLALSQGEVLLREYDAAKQADLETRKASK